MVLYAIIIGPVIEIPVIIFARHTAPAKVWSR